jgi:prevent-host-death family protein
MTSPEHPNRLTLDADAAQVPLADLLDHIKQGTQVVITRHGRPIARLIPANPTDANRALAAVDRMTQRRHAMAASGIRFTQDELLVLRHHGRP